MTYYNEHDPKVAQWLRNLIAAGELEGVVDERDVREVRADELRRYSRVHLFAGIGGWELALRYAGWPAGLPVWTGSCPCQPFSSAGKRLGTADSRHLWPAMRRLIAECKPICVFGEQVTSPAGREWLAGVRADLEDMGYAVGAADLCAAGEGAPHIRQRLYWVADANGRDACAERLQRSREHRQQPQDRMAGRVADTENQGPCPTRQEQTEPGRRECEPGRTGVRMADWSDYRVANFRDEKARRIESIPQQMANGFSDRMGRTRTGKENIARVIKNANASEELATEAVREVWLNHAEEANERTTRRCESVREAPVLLSYMRELAREGWKLANNLPSACWESTKDGVRELRSIKQEASCPSLRWERSEQRTRELEDLVRSMSSAIASSAEADWIAPWPLAHGVPGRVVKLRAYGNAIVPQVAATFVRAYMEARQICEC